MITRRYIPCRRCCEHARSRRHLDAAKSVMRPSLWHRLCFCHPTNFALSTSALATSAPTTQSNAESATLDGLDHHLPTDSEDPAARPTTVRSNMALSGSFVMRNHEKLPVLRLSLGVALWSKSLRSPSDHRCDIIRPPQTCDRRACRSPLKREH